MIILESFLNNRTIEELHIIKDFVNLSKCNTNESLVNKVNRVIENKIGKIQRFWDALVSRRSTIAE